MAVMVRSKAKTFNNINLDDLFADSYREVGGVKTQKIDLNCCY